MTVETLHFEVASDVLADYGKEPPPDLKGFVNGRRPIEIFTSLVQRLQLQEKPENLLAKAQELLRTKSQI